MKVKDIEIGKFYRHKDSPKYAWAKAVEILQQNTRENTTSKLLVKCEWVINQSDSCGLIKYFKVSDLLMK